MGENLAITAGTVQLHGQIIFSRAGHIDEEMEFVRESFGIGMMISLRSRQAILHF